MPRTSDGREIGRQEWLELRRTGIGASEIAAVLGISPYDDDTPLHLYLRKVGQLPEKEETEAMWWGSAMEPLIARRYAERYSIAYAAEQVFLRHPSHPFLIATLDRITEDGIVVELKSIGLRGAGMLGLDGTDEVPPSWVVQVQQQLMVAEACLPGFVEGEAGDIAAVVGGQQMHYFTVRRDERLCRQIVERGAAFWSRVERQDPPEPLPGRDGRLLAHLYPKPEGEIEATVAIQSLADQWEILGDEIGPKEEQRRIVRDELIRLLGHAETALLMDGRRLKKSVTPAKPERTVTMAASKAYSQLRILKARPS